VNDAHYTISPYVPDSRDRLLDFRAVHYGFGSTRAEASYVDWLYSDPYQSQPGTPALFVCADRDRIVGAQGLVRISLKAGDQYFPSAWVIDFAVRRELQRNSGLGLGPGGIGSAIARASREVVPVRLAMNVSAAAVPLAVRDGWQHVCDVPLWIRPLDARKAQEGRHPRLTALGAAAVGQVALDALFDHGVRIARQRRLQLVETRAFDERGDAVWSSVSSDYSIICGRSQAYLQWRFDRFPRPNAYTRFWLRDAAGIVGYVVTSISDHKGLRAGFLIDYLCRPRTSASMLALTLETFREAGAVLVYCLNLRPAANKMFRPLGFLLRRSGWPFMIYTRELPPEAARLMSEPSS
jgi:hypothetical protein